MSGAYGKATQTLLSLLRLRQHNRALRLDFPHNDGPDNGLLVPNELIAHESMSRDFTFTVQVLSDRPDITDKALIGKMVTISLVRDDGKLRYFNGHIFSLRFVKNDAGFCHYELILKPWLAFLRHSRNSYLFNGMTLQEQITQLFSRYDGCDWTTTALDADDAMTDAFQFNESDYNYFHRRIEAKGWHYRYVHRADGHQLVLSADSTQCEPIDGSGELTWQGSTSGVKHSGVQTFSPVHRVSANRYSASSFDFKRPGVTTAECSTIDAPGSLQQLDVVEHLGAYGFANREGGPISQAAHGGNRGNYPTI